MSRRTKAAGIIVLVLAAAACAGAAYVAYALQQVDPFYADAVKVDPAEAAAAGRQLEERVAELNAPKPHDHWQAKFTEDEVNGWLAAVLKERLPELLPPQVQDPRVRLADGRVDIAYRYVGNPLTTVVTLETEPRMAREGLLAIRLVAARAGIIPVGESLVIQEVDLLAQQLNWPIEWSHVDGHLELSVPMRDLFSTNDEQRTLADVDFNAGEVVLGGSAAAREPEAPGLTQAASE